MVPLRLVSFLGLIKISYFKLSRALASISLTQSTLKKNHIAITKLSFIDQYYYNFISGNDVSQDTLLLHGPFARKPKRIRTAFSPSQLLRLERAFEKNHYVVGAERKQLANSLSLSETQVNMRKRMLYHTTTTTKT